MPPKKKPQAPVEPIPSGDKLTGMFGWCLLPQHALCPGEAPSIRCSCNCHTEEKVEKDEPATPRTDS